MQDIDRERQREEKRSRGDDRVDGGERRKHLEPRCVCGRCETVDKRITRLCAQTMRAQALWMSVEVVVGVRIVQCHAIMNVVIGVRVMNYHAIIDVVRVMLFHRAIMFNPLL